MSGSWNYAIYPCGNLLCRINRKGFCDAGNMLNLLCSNEDIYKNCKEKIYGEVIINNLKRLTDFSLYKDKKNNLIKK